MKTKYYFTLIALLIIQSAIYSQTHTWTGNGGDNNWFNTDNWDVGSVPSSESEILIPTGFVVEIITEAAAANSITINGISTINLENNLNFLGQLSIPEGGNINWLSGIINGGGTIENNGLIQLEAFEDKKLINTTINNNGAIYITNSNQIKLSGACVINNNETGIIEILSNGGFLQEEPGNTCNNMGSIKKMPNGSGSLGSFYMLFDMNNYGTIEIDENQQLLFLGSDITLNNTESGILKGFGAFDITSNFNNAGTLAPGSEGTPGTLTVLNYLSLSSASILEFDITGKVAGEFDVIDVAGFPDLTGNIIVTLSFEPDLGDEFPIITANNIQSCDFPQSISAQYLGYDYTFEISCNNTSLVLKVVDIVLGVDEMNSESITFYVQPNPVKSFANIVFNTSNEITIPNNKLTLHVYTSLGLEVMVINNFTQTNYQFKKGNLSAGLFILQIKSGNSLIASTKMVIE